MAELIALMPRLIRAAVRDVGAADGEDLAQDVLLVATRQLQEGAFKGASTLKTWVYGILKNKILEYKRRQRRALRNERLGKSAADAAAERERPVEDEYHLRLILDAACKGFDSSELFVLRFKEEGRRSDWIGHQLRKSPDHVDRCYREIKAALRRIVLETPSDRETLDVVPHVSRNARGREH
jgi:RNA polymerase sigma factor (sigma-70 family)